MIKTRFAPSPTGNLHVGNCRTALINWLFTKAHGGKFLLRFDDTDRERSKEEYVKNIKTTFDWLNLEIDEMAHQSQRMARYEEVFQDLLKKGLVYACYETPEELNIKRKSCLTSGRPPIYDREGLRLTDSQKKVFEESGRRPHWRFKLNESEKVEWNDLVRGKVTFHELNMSDPVLIREDGTPLYMFASVIDDLDLGITHIIRGEDHVSNTALQIQLFTAIHGSLPTIQFAHLPLISGAEGQALSKRLGSHGVLDLKEEGLFSISLANYLSNIGTGRPLELRQTLEEVISDFSIEDFARATPRFSFKELEALNAKFIQSLPYASAKQIFNFPNDFSEGFWDLIKENIEGLQDIKTWLSIHDGKTLKPLDKEDHAFLKKAASLLEGENLEDASFWEGWISSLKSSTGRKGKGLFMPLRKALTGQEHGPELKRIIQLMGYEKTMKRLKRAANDPKTL